MEETKPEKKAWQSPEIEVINTKLTQGGSHPWSKEDAYYYDPYSS
jgi:hypothetical protein